METEVIGVYWGWKPLGYEEKIFSQQVKGGNSALARVKDGSIRKCLRVSHVSRAKVKVHTALIDDAVRRHAFVGLTRGSRLPCQNTLDRKSTRLNSSHSGESRMPSSA